MENDVATIQAKVCKRLPRALASWDDFLSRAPQSDDETHYLETHPHEWKIPFGDRRLTQLINGTLAPLNMLGDAPVRAAAGTSSANVLLWCFHE
jgi:hypothetical protein